MPELTLLSDQPITSIEKDELRRKEFAQSVASTILGWNLTDSLCIGVNGRWGSGKTSTLNMCLSYIASSDSENRPIIVHFNPWLIQNQNQIVNSFLTALRHELHKIDINRYLSHALSALDTYEFAMRGAFVVMPPTPETTILRKFNLLIKMLVTLWKGRQENTDAESAKQQVENELSSLNKKILIVIDDIDRLQVDDVLQVFKVIKAVADFPNTIYLMCLDIDVTEKLLRKVYRNYSPQYIEKIIQVQFDIPKPTRNSIADILFRELQHVFDSTPAEEHEKNRWLETKYGSFQTLFTDLRSVKRFVNAVNCRRQILGTSINLLDIVLMEAIHMFAYEVFVIISDNERLVLSDDQYPDEKERKQWLENLALKVPEAKRGKIKDVLTLLFPVCRDAYGSWVTPSYSNNYEKYKRICTRKYYEYYFQAIFSEEEIYEDEITSILDVIDNMPILYASFRRYIEQNNFLKLLNKLEYVFEDASESSKLASYFAGVFEVAETYPIEYESDLPATWKMMGTAYRLLKKVPKKERKDIVLEAIKKTNKALWLPIEVIHLIWIEWHPRDGSSEKEEAERLLTDDETNTLVSRALELIEKHKSTGILENNTRLSSVLYRWADWKSLEEVKEWVTNTLVNDEHIPNFLRGFITFSSSQTVGSSFVNIRARIYPDSIKELCDIEALRRRCEDIINSSPPWLTEEGEQIIKIFLQEFKKSGFGYEE